MEYKEIEELLNRYFEGDTTLEEEARLKEYFSRQGLPPEQLPMQEMFRYFAEARLDSVPSFDIEGELNSLVEKEWKKDTRFRLWHKIAWAGSAAAVLAISFALYHNLNYQEPAVKDTFKDPRLAYIEAKRALLLVSNTMNRNSSGLKYLAKVDESFNHMNKIAKIDKVVNAAKNK